MDVQCHAGYCDVHSFTVRFSRLSSGVLVHSQMTTYLPSTSVYTDTQSLSEIPRAMWVSKTKILKHFLN